MVEKQQQQKPVVIITGASGLIGSRICQKIKDDYQLVGLDLKSPDDKELSRHHIDTDITETESVHNALEKVKAEHGTHIACVIHLAAYYDFTGEPSPLYEILTVDGTERLLHTLQQLQFNVEQFVFSSSLLVMEPDEQARNLTELSGTQAEWAYPQSKLEAERVIKENHGEISYVILRIAGVYDEHCHSLPVSRQIARIYEKQFQSYVFPGDPTHGQVLVHLEDLAECVQSVIAKRQVLDKEEMFLIAEPTVMSYGELQDQIGLLIHGSEWPTLRVPKFVAKAGAYVADKISSLEDRQFIKPWMIDLADDHYAVNNVHASTKLGWQPKHRLQETLPLMINFLKENPKAFYQENGLAAQEELEASQ